jgi:hypothetical protein
VFARDATPSRRANKPRLPVATTAFSNTPIKLEAPRNFNLKKNPAADSLQVQRQANYWYNFHLQAMPVPGAVSRRAPPLIVRDAAFPSPQPG